MATGYTGTVHFTSSDRQAVLPGNYTFTAADAGMHTFSATLKTAGTQSLTATDAANAALSGAQAGISVTAAAASRLVLERPGQRQGQRRVQPDVTVAGRLRQRRHRLPGHGHLRQLGLNGRAAEELHVHGGATRACTPSPAWC